MGVNRAGVVAAILNRAGTLGPAVGKRSRGEIPLLALRHVTAEQAAAAVGQIDAAEWRDFNLVVGDRFGAFFIRGLGRGHPTAERLPEGVAMVTAYDPNDLESPRVARHLQRLRHHLPDGPDDWAGWRAILADRSGEVGEQINVAPRGDFATVCSSFVAVSTAGLRQPGCSPPGRRMRLSFARSAWDSRPERTPGNQRRQSLEPGSICISRPAENPSNQGCRSVAPGPPAVRGYWRG